MNGALSGLRVLDFTQVILGPSCTAVLADHGADVIKVERPGSGDLSRAFGPFKNGASLSYGTLNRNKRSIAINLKNNAGRDLIYRMVAAADVVINNFRPGVMEGLGLGYEDLKKHNPRIIYATGTGFGASGPLADSRKAGHDTMAQALTGAMSTNAGADGTPRRIPLPVADMTAGNLLVQGILMALLARQKRERGRSWKSRCLTPCSGSRRGMLQARPIHCLPGPHARDPIRWMAESITPQTASSL